MNYEKLVDQIVRRWTRFGERATGLKYPSKSESLRLHGICRKTILDFLPLTFFGQLS